MHPKKKPYDPFIQVAAMRSRFPNFKARRKKKKLDIEFTGTLDVKAGWPQYTVSVRYQGDLPPIVKILSPTLVDEPPHFYKVAKEPCLYKPKNFKWDKTKLIATTILPWLAGWIYFYEIWLKKGKWLGPEAEHDRNEEKLNNAA